MTIKQQGGIFGRNPTFNDVDVEGTLTVNGEPISDFGSMAQQDADSVNIDGGAIDGTTIGSSTPAAGSFTTFTSTGIDDNAASTSLVIASNGNATIKAPNNSGGGVLNLENTTTAVNGTDWGSINFISNDSSSGASGIRASIVATSTSFNGDGNIVFSTAASNGTNTEHMRLNAAGNLAFANGKGIDFSATSGTGTSELFDDYEEGTWTPTLTFGDASVGITYAVQGGTYTKVGNLVTGRFIIVLSNKGSSTGIAAITGLPYTVGSDVGVASVEVASNFTTNVVQSGYAGNTTTGIVLNYFSSTGTALVDNTNFNNNTRLDMWFSYFV